MTVFVHIVIKDKRLYLFHLYPITINLSFDTLKKTKEITCKSKI